MGCLNCIISSFSHYKQLYLNKLYFINGQLQFCSILDLPVECFDSKVVRTAAGYSWPTLGLQLKCKNGEQVKENISSGSDDHAEYTLPSSASVFSPITAIECHQRLNLILRTRRERRIGTIQ